MAAAGRESAATARDDALVGGRYEVRELLASGGMGDVYRVFDWTRQCAVALKRLRLKDTPDRAQHVPMFEREFHTLARLAHPRIIEVYEYGFDTAGPYYTMELLDGTDLSHLAPLPYTRACAFLRDVASSLALLHTRRMLHRDVSPRNVRRTSSGRCKLLDFGTMTPFGTPHEIAGTAPFVPPEAVHGLALDQRADLYGLGALAYFLLTGRHAYPAPRLDALPVVWAHPPSAPSSHEATIPEALDRLVMSLLSRDAMARPASAAEVIDSLVAIGNLDPEDDSAIGQSYFLGSRLVGRSRELAELHERLDEAVGSHGAVALIEGGRGLGKSRLLDELVVQGQTKGAVVVREQCSHDAAPYRLASRIARSVLASIPVEAQRAAKPFVQLGHLLPELAPERPVPLPENPMERRARLQWALTEWLVSLAEQRAVVLCIDDLHHVDESSAAVLLALARRASQGRLLIAATLRSDAETEAAAAIAALRNSSQRIIIDRFDKDETLELCRSLFGDARNLERLGHRLFELSGGNPLTCVEIVRALVSDKAIAYADGMWLLPSEIDSTTVAATLDEAMDGRVEKVSPEARHLARLLSLYGGPATLTFCRALTPSDTACFALLDELVSQDIVIWHGDAYRFSRDALREAFRRSIVTEQLPAMHRSVGLALEQLGTDSPASLVEAGWHLLAGGEPSRGAELLERGANVQFTDGMASAIQALEAALQVYEQQRRPLETIVRIKSKLVGAAFPVDRRLAERYGRETLSLLLEHTGLDIALQLQPRIGKRAGLYAGLATAATRRVITPVQRRGPPIKEAFTMFLPTLGSMLGVASTCLDVEKAEELVELVEPLTGFGPHHIGSAFYAHCSRFLNMVQGREAEAHASSMRFLEQLDDAEGLLAMSEEMRIRWKGGSWIVRGQMEVFRDGTGALECAGELESLGFEFHRAWAQQIRMLYHAMRGEMELAEAHRRALDVHFLRNGTVWQLEIGPSVSLCAAYGLVGDVTRLKETLEQLERTAKSVPSLRLYCDLVRLSYRNLRGDYRGAIELYETLRHRILPRRHIGWPALYSYSAQAFNSLGEHESAKHACERALRYVRDEDRMFVALYLPLERELALAEAGLGQLQQGAARLDALLAEHGPRRGPITCGSLHEARARLAAMAGDGSAFDEHLSATEDFYRPTNHPSLLARCERLLRVRPASATRRPLDRVLRETTTVVSEALAGSESYEDRAERALKLVLTHHGREHGYLFTQRGPDVHVIAASALDEPPASLLEHVRDMFFACDENTQTEMVSASISDAADSGTPGDYQVALLSTECAGKLKTVGVVAMDRSADTAAMPDFTILEAVARELSCSAP